MVIIQLRIPQRHPHTILPHHHRHPNRLTMFQRPQHQFLRQPPPPLRSLLLRQAPIMQRPIHVRVIPCPSVQVHPSHLTPAAAEITLSSVCCAAWICTACAPAAALITSTGFADLYPFTVSVKFVPSDITSSASICTSLGDRIFSVRVAGWKTIEVLGTGKLHPLSRRPTIPATATM